MLCPDPAKLLQWAFLLTVLAALTACPDHSPAGAQVYASFRCAICHGADRAGTKLAPPLRGLIVHWTADKLVNDYFPDPVAYQNADPRLSGMLKTYNTMKMPPVKGTPAELHALADWLLED